MRKKLPSRIVPRKPNGTLAESIIQEILLTTEQVARYLKVDKFTVYRLVTQRKIPAFKGRRSMAF